MASVSETGHGKNVSNFELLIATVTDFGADYNPSNGAIKVASLNTILTDCQRKQKGLNDAVGVFEPIENSRMEAFADVNKLVRRVDRLAKSCGAGVNFYNDVHTLVAKITGTRLSKAKPTATDPAGTSASQVSYDMIQEHFDGLVSRLLTEPKYAPSKVDVSMGGLTTKLNLLKATNSAVKAGLQPLQKAKGVRDTAFYTVETGLCDIAQTCKNEVRGTFGFSTPEFKRVSKIQFRNFGFGF